MARAQVFERVPVQPRDAREASDVFYKQGTGDVLLNYENEVYFTNRMYGEKDALPYIVPDRNIRVSCHARHPVDHLQKVELPSTEPVESQYENGSAPLMVYGTHFICPCVTSLSL